jgi:hypothetical protein
MKNIKGFALGLVVGLALAVSSLAFAQDTKTTTAKPSCCAESCSMNHGKDHDKSKHEGKEGCCCCCTGDSCDMHMKEKKQG